MSPIFKKSAAAFTIGCFVLLAATLLVPGSANAQAGAPQPVITLQDYAAMQAKAVASAKTAVMNSTKYAITSAILTAVDTAAQRIAANAATFIVSGGKGKTPLAYITEWKSWHDNILMDTVSDSINTLTTKYLQFGICAPINTQLDLRIKLGIAQLYAPHPNCTFNQAWNSVLADKNNITSGKILSTVTLGFQMGASPLSIAMNTQYAIVNKALKVAADDVNQRLTSPYKPLTDAISGNVKTPAKIMEDTALTPIRTINQAEAAKKNVEISNIDLLAAVGANALKVFTSTLASKAIDKYLKGGTLSGKDILCASSAGKNYDLCKGVINSTADAGAVSGSTDSALASAYFASLFTPSVGQIDDYSPINDLSACPSDPAVRGIWNCVMDQGFVKALSADENGHLSVAQAIAAGDLNGGWQLIPPNADCYGSNYCYTNLMKLRRMRIIPVGWEMAAIAAENTANFPNGLTLNAAVAGFNNCAVDANGIQHLDATHPLCHLVDPDWILKVPVTQCKAQASGQTLAAPNTSERAEVCVDSPSCVSEDADGKCTGGYGYCTREKNVWSIDATECPAQYASCDTFSDPNGKDLSILKNTVDVAACSADNAGCRPYATAPGANGWVDLQPSVYLTSQAPECDAKSAGCRSLSDLKTAATANLIPNPSFETPRADGAMAAGWRDMTGKYVQDGIFSFDGISAYHVMAPANGAGLTLGGWNDNVPTDPDHYAEVQVQPQTLYTLSFYAKGGATSSGELIMKAFDAPFYGAKHACSDGNNLSTCLQNMTHDIGYSPACTTTASGGATGKIACHIIDNYDNGQMVTASALEFDFPLSSGYERQTMTFATSSDTHYLSFDFGWGDYYIDVVQLEAGATATPFHTGGSDLAGQTVNLKVPPAYLGCTGEDSDAGKGCSAYAPVCRQSEVGCDEFTPSENTGIPITAVASGNDACNAECVGYSTYKQEPTLWASEQFPLYFIPSTAKSCDLAQVGCDEFTNLAAAASGGESKSYFTSIRACRQPDAASDGNYFIWEGSGASGYQLKSFVLVNRAANDRTMEAVPDAASGPNGTTFVQKTDPSKDPNPPGPVYLTGTVISQCNQDVYNGANGAVKNPDCRELIDANGNIFYRLLSATIAADAACQTFRKTVSKQDDCQGSGGIWNATAAACDYFVLAAQSNSCSASANGCRAYAGNQGNNVQNIFLSDFENGQLDGWNGGAASTESTVAGEHSYAAVTAHKPLVYPSGSPLLVQGRSYTLTVWAKGTGTLTASFVGKNIGANDRSQYFSDPKNNPIALGSEWQRYQLGPVIINWAPDSGDVLEVGSFGGKGFFDNIELDATQGVFALVAGSWKTPAVCDQTSAGQALPQAQLGCSEYSSKTSGAAVDLKSFDHLCRAQAVGCAAFTDTQGTDTPFASFKNAYCGIGSVIDKSKSNDCLFNGKTVCSAPPGQTSCRFDFDGSADQLGNTTSNGVNYTTLVADDTFVVPPDTTEYLVNDGSTFSCDASEVGCTALGDNDLNTLGTCSLGNDSSGKHKIAATVQMCFSKDGTAARCNVYPGQTSCSYRIPWTVNKNTVYRTIDPSNLGQQLCTQDAVSCQEWTTTSGDKAYFKDPGTALCEYKDTATLNGNTVSGWFKKGTSEPCDPKFIANGNALGIRRNLDPEFSPNNFAGVCPAEQSACTEFTDHSDLGADLTDATGKVIGHEFATGRPFYYINDSKITDASAACNGTASQKMGYLVLDQTDNPQKKYSTAATYKSSDGQGYKLVPPIDGTTLLPPQVNDANILLKVTRDRVCSEWLECNTDQTTADPATGRDTTRCLSLGSCLKKGADGRCSEWGQLDPNAKALTSALYASRDVASSGSDFSGFSIPGQSPVSLYIQKLSGSATYKLDTKGIAPVAQTCKEYPETDSPFPRTVTDTFGSTRKTGFDNVNVCEYSAGDNKYPASDCECSYRKAAYGVGITKYFPPNAETGTRDDGTPGEIKGAICSGGLYDGKECWPTATGDRIEPTNLSCTNGTNGGTCEPLTSVDSRIGEEGYCLEHDDTLRINGSTNENACITWLPIDSVQGRDTANQFTSAAFIPKIGQERYCAAPAEYCVPHDCAQPPEVPAICTELRNANINGVSVNPRGYGCFLKCAVGDHVCITNEKKVCLPLLNEYCGSLLKATNDGWSGGPGDLLCVNLGYGHPASWPGNHCFDGSYATDPQCTEAINTYYDGEKRINGSVGSPDDIFKFNPSYNVDSFCGFDTSQVVDPATGKSPADAWNNGLEDCATTDRQFCGNPPSETDPSNYHELCPGGTECAPMNDLSVNQNEYTSREQTEVYCMNINREGTQCEKAMTAANIIQQSDVETMKCCDNAQTFSYKTKPAFGAHTFFGASDTNEKADYTPLLSSNSLVFKPVDHSGTWVNLQQQAEGVSADENAQNVCSITGACSETANTSTDIGSFPQDLLGLYYFNSPDASVSYELTSPALLLLSQIDRVVVKVMSYADNGLCQYGARINDARMAAGECFAGAPDSAALSVHFNRSLFEYNSAREDYGYEPSGVSGQGQDDANYSSVGLPSFITLSDSNQWSGSLNGIHGSTTVSLVISDDEPKRVTGVKVDLTVPDSDQRAWIYIAALDVRLRGPVCGAATYVGSSNPTADPKFWPVVNTDIVNNQNKDYESLKLNGITVASNCSPWGAISISNPPSRVTSSQATGSSDQCELDKGAIYGGAALQQKIFARAVSVNMFNDVNNDFTNPTPMAPYTSLAPWAVSKDDAGKNLPQVSSAVCSGDSDSCQKGPTAGSTMSINNVDTGVVTGVGSLRANLKFYATADKNQMPIRSVKIDWKDNTDFVDPGLQNYYKNHDGGIDTVKNTSNCSTNSSFAQTSNTCDTKPFAYSHVYACNTGATNRTADKDYPNLGLTKGQPDCVYAPTVSVTDNWGATVSPIVSANVDSTVKVILAPAQQ